MDVFFILIALSDECGIVAQISEPLATADIPAYYISTFKFDHALVSDGLQLYTLSVSLSLFVW